MQMQTVNGFCSEMPSEPGRVALIQASDTVRTVPVGQGTIGYPKGRVIPTNTVAHSTKKADRKSPFQQNQGHRMSKQPVRVVAQPPRLPTMHVPPMAGRSYNEMVDFAERQRQQIEANKREEDRKIRAQAQMGGDVKDKLRQTRRQLAEEECELNRLTELERETRAFRSRNADSQNVLTNLHNTLDSHQIQLRSAITKVDGLKAQLEELRRRRQNAQNAAAAEQRRLLHVQQIRQQQEQSRVTPVHIQDIPAQRPRASVEPFSVQISKTPSPEDVKKPFHQQTKERNYNSQLIVSPPSDDQCSESSQSTVPSPPAPSQKPRDNREDVSPSPPKDPHPTTEEPHSPSTASESDPGQQYNLAMAAEMAQLPMDRPSQIGGEIVEEPLRLRQGKTDLVSLRPHSLQATKRRSWAASDNNTMSELDAIKRVLLEAQKRGDNHFCPQMPLVEEQPASQKLAPVKELEPVAENVTDEESAATKSDEEPMEMEIVPEKKAVKGILRPLGLKKPHRRIEIDPLALLLDAALEGEMELVKTCAGKLSDVSVANDEGITALHNAICAGHYEIVKFLIDQHADVNAQDSDGWTPLHCAASCNNLPMVRLLVEGGACLLATTLSDLETPIEKCEEDEEGYDGCLNYLLAAHNSTGVVNGGKVYAAYSYEAQYDDELTFEGGQELKVLRKDDEEKGWWRCERISAEESSESGLCPRTYLSLYPPIKYRQQLGFVPFQIPLESNNNADSK